MAEQTDAEPPSSWRRLLDCFHRVQMFGFSILALLPIVDVLSDLVAVANFAYSGHFWWAALVLVVIYMSGRFVVLLTTLCPTPSAWNLLCLYCPLCWQRLREYDPPGKETPAEVEGPTRVRGGTVVVNVAGGGKQSSTSLTPGQNAQKARDNATLIKMTRNGFNVRVNKILKKYPPDYDEGCLWFLCVGLRAEYKLFPLAFLAIIPIGISACELSGSYMRAALGQPDDPDAGSDATSASKDRREKVELFQKTASIAEALSEGVPQLLVQARAGFYGGELNDWVFRASLTISTASVVKAIVVFCLNREKIWNTFRALHAEDVLFFRALTNYDFFSDSGLMNDLRIDVNRTPGRFIEASLDDVRANMDLLCDPTSGLGSVCNVAHLTGGLQVHGPTGDFRVEKSTYETEHTLYAFKTKLKMADDDDN